jgi:hypothetical protein
MDLAPDESDGSTRARSDTMSSKGALVELRSSLRVGRRMVRRAAVSARDVGPRAFVASVFDGRRPSRSITNASLTWATAREGRNTVVWIHEYWNDTYGVVDPAVTVTLIRDDGSVVAAWSLPLTPRSTHAVDVRGECLARGVALPFEGQLRAEIDSDALVGGRPLQLLAEYRDDNANASMVHGQYGPSARPLAQVIGAIRVDPDAVAQWLSLTNGFAGGPRSSMRPQVTIRAHDGRTRRVRLPAVAAGTSTLVDLHALVPDLATFLGGRAGQVGVRLPYPASRIASCTVFADGRRVVNHGTIDRVFDQSRGVPSNWSESWPVVSVPFVARPDLETVITVPNRLGPVLGPQRVTITLYDAGGTSVGDETHDIDPDAMVEIRSHAVLGRLGVPEPFVGHVELTARLLDDSDAQPAILDVVVGIEHRGLLIGEVLAGGAFFNAPVPPRFPSPDVRRTRVFGLVRLGAGERTHVFLANPAGRDDYEVRSETVLTLVDETGCTVATAEVQLAPHGGRWFDLDLVFPTGRAALEPTGVGALRVRDTTARVYGYFVIENGGQTVMIDHLVGG